MLHHDTCMQDPFPQTPLRCRPSRLTFGFCLQQIPIYRLAAAALAPFKVQGDREAGALHTHNPWTQNGNGVGEWLFDRHPWPGAIYKRMALQLQHWPLATVHDGRRSLRGHQSRASLLCAPCRAPAIASYCTLAQVAPQEAKALGHPQETEPQPRASGDEN